MHDPQVMLLDFCPPEVRAGIWGAGQCRSAHVALLPLTPMQVADSIWGAAATSSSCWDTENLGHSQLTGPRLLPPAPAAPALPAAAAGGDGALHRGLCQLYGLRGLPAEAGPAAQAAHGGAVRQHRAGAGQEVGARPGVFLLSLLL